MMSGGCVTGLTWQCLLTLGVREAGPVLGEAGLLVLALAKFASHRSHVTVLCLSFPGLNQGGPPSLRSQGG